MPSKQGLFVFIKLSEFRLPRVHYTDNLYLVFIKSTILFRVTATRFFIVSHQLQYRHNNNPVNLLYEGLRANKFHCRCSSGPLDKFPGLLWRRGGHQECQQPTSDTSAVGVLYLSPRLEIIFLKQTVILKTNL